MLSGTSHAVDHKGPGGWLRQRRTRLALWIAAAEGVVVAVSHDVTKWTVTALAIIAVLSFAAGRNTKYATVRQVLWIFAASQLLALILVILGWVVKWAVILALVLFAIGGLVFLLVDRR